MTHAVDCARRFTVHAKFSRRTKAGHIVHARTQQKASRTSWTTTDIPSFAPAEFSGHSDSALQSLHAYPMTHCQIWLCTQWRMMCDEWMRCWAFDQMPITLATLWKFHHEISSAHRSFASDLIVIQTQKDGFMKTRKTRKLMFHLSVHSDHFRAQCTVARTTTRAQVTCDNKGVVADIEYR